MRTDQMSHWHEFAGNVLKVSVLQAKDNQCYLHNILIYLGLPPGLSFKSLWLFGNSI